MAKYKYNPDNSYALYMHHGEWRESASIKNDDLNPDGTLKGDSSMITEGPVNSVEPVKEEPKETGSKYIRSLVGLNGVVVPTDIYRVLHAYSTGIPQLDHLSKKSLCAGLRGHKSLEQDLVDIIEAAQNALLMVQQINKANDDASK